ncbi:unnamed protein product [Gadus morhua 'NCC']
MTMMLTSTDDPIVNPPHPLSLSSQANPGTCLNAPPAGQRRHLPLRLPLLANAGIYLYAAPCWPTPIYLYASPCWPTPIYLYASPCWFAAMPIPRHASLDVQPRLTEARPDPDTPAQMRAAVARYLAANALKDKALSTEQQKGWAAREEKYRKEWEQVGVWAVGVKVTTGLTTAAWEHTLKESEWAATRRANAKKERDKDSVDYRKKRDKYTYALLNAYNAAINMEARKREGRPTDLSRQEKTVLKGLSAQPHVEEHAAPLTLDGADVEGKGTPCGEDNTSLRNNTYPSLEENPPFPNNTRAPPPYGCYDHPAPRNSKGPALQFPILHIEKGPVDISYNDQPPPSFAGGSQDYGGVEYDSTKGPKDGTDRVIKGRSGPGAII